MPPGAGDETPTVTTWPDGFPAHPGRARRRISAAGGLRPPCRTAPGRLVDHGRQAGGRSRAAGLRRPGGRPGRVVDPRQAGPAADGGGEKRRRRPGRRQRLPRRRHLHRQLDGPVDLQRPAGRHRGQRRAAAAGGQRRRRRRPGVAVEVADRHGAVAPGAGADPNGPAGPRPGGRPRPEDARPGHHHRLRSRRRRQRRARRHRDRGPFVQRGSGQGHRLRRGLRAGPARRRAAAGAQAFPRPRAWLRRLAQGWRGHASAERPAEQRPGAVPDAGDRDTRSP